MKANKGSAAPIPSTSGESSRVDLSETALHPHPAASVPQQPASADPALAWVGKSLGKYQIQGVLGQGAMGVVLKGRDPMIERDVAIKILAPHLAADQAALGRFLDEARAAGKLNHPNVTAIYEIGRDGPTYYLVLEYVPGGNLGARQAGDEAMPVLEATRAMIDACKGVSAAHAAGLIHRDLKPANLMRAADGSIKVADFGLAKIGTDLSRQFTQTGFVVGTPLYMGPEQCEARPLDERSDIYSLGATYYSLLTGRYPYEASDTIAQLMYLHCHGPVPDPRAVHPGIPEACARIIARAMAKAPADRYPSAGAMQADLQAVVAALSGHTPVLLSAESGASVSRRPMEPAGSDRPTGRPPFPWVVAALLFLILTAAAVWLGRSRAKAPSSPAPAPAIASAGEPVPVGIIHSLTGTMANSETPVVDAALFAIDEVNRAGGVLGRPVRPVVADGRSSGRIFAQEAERLLTEDRVCTLFGCWTSSSRKMVKSVVEQHDHLLLYPVQFEGLETSPNIVYLGAAPNQQILPAIRWAFTQHHKRRFFLVGSDYVFPRAAHAMIKDYLPRLGGQVVGEQYLRLGSQDVKPIVRSIAQAHPDMILNTINGDSNTAFFRALRAAGIRPNQIPTLSFSVGEQELRSVNVADLEGDYAAWMYFQTLTTPENLEFVRRFRERYPHRRITDPMETTYVGVKLWAMAANDAQSLDPPRIRRALLNRRWKGPDGLIRIDADNQYSFRTPRIGRLQADGKFQIVWAAAEPLHPEPYPDSRTAEAWRAFLNDLYVGWGRHWAAPKPGATGDAGPHQ